MIRQIKSERGLTVALPRWSVWIGEVLCTALRADVEAKDLVEEGFALVVETACEITVEACAVAVPKSHLPPQSRLLDQVHDRYHGPLR